MAPSPARRNTRSARLTVAVLALFLATSAVATGIVVQTPVVLVAASVVAVLLGALATRLTYLALADERRAAQSDRVALAREYAEMAVARTEESAALVHTLRLRLRIEYDLGARLKDDLRDVRRRLEASEDALTAARGETAARTERVVELEAQVADLKAELVAWADAARPEGDKRRQTA